MHLLQFDPESQITGNQVNHQHSIQQQLNLQLDNHECY